MIGVITLALAGIITLVTVGLIWTIIQKGIPEWTYELKNNWQCGDYLNAYWIGLFGIILAFILVGGLSFGSFFLIDSACYHMGWTEKSFFKQHDTYEPPAKHIRYDVDSKIDVHTDFVHEGKVIHQEQL
jgi:hypothetical protein